MTGRPVAVLIGPPGAGKSTIGRRVAQALSIEIFDTDIAIEQHAGRSIPEIFVEDGEERFREIEEEVVLESLRTHEGILSLGGGAILSDRTRAALRDHRVVYLEISVAEGLRRTRVSNRPVLAGDDPRARYRQLMQHRRPLYREVADIRVRTEGRSPARVAQTVVEHLQRLATEAESVRLPNGVAAQQQTSGSETSTGRTGGAESVPSEAHVSNSGPSTATGKTAGRRVRRRSRMRTRGARK